MEKQQVTCNMRWSQLRFVLIFCRIQPSGSVRLDSGADLRSILDNLRDNGINDSNDGDGSECDSEDDEGGDTE